MPHLHDASEVAREIPTVMIFSSSIAGLSHTKEEDARGAPCGSQRHLPPAPAAGPSTSSPPASSDVDPGRPRRFLGAGLISNMRLTFLAASSVEHAVVGVHDIELTQRDGVGGARRCRGDDADELLDAVDAVYVTT